MNVEPLAARLAETFRQPLPAPPRQARRALGPPPAAVRTPAEAGRAAARAGDEEPPILDPAMGFQVDHRDGGAVVVRLVDLRSGHVVLQLPPEGVLRHVAALVQSLRRVI